MKCYRCGRPKTTKGNSLCSDCKKEYDKKYYSKEKNRKAQIQRAVINTKKMRIWTQTLKEKSCVDCGVQYPYYTMHWDHLPQYAKRDNINYLVNRVGSKRIILQEIAKCELVCANCHAERTHQRELAPSSGTGPKSSKL